MIEEHCGKNSYSKKAPEFIKSLCPRQIRIFLENLYLGDGHQAKTSLQLTTVSKKLVDDVQELILKCGDTSYYYKRDADAQNSYSKSDKYNIVATVDSYCVNWMSKSFYHETMNKKQYQLNTSQSYFEDWTYYSGYVYCVESPSGVICVRRNGKHYFCGNSPRVYYSGIYNDIQEGQIEEAIAWLEGVCECKCENCGRTGNPDGSDIRVTRGWLSRMCDSCAIAGGRSFPEESDGDFE